MIKKISIFLVAVALTSATAYSQERDPAAKKKNAKGVSKSKGKAASRPATKTAKSPSLVESKSSAPKPGGKRTVGDLLKGYQDLQKKQLAIPDAVKPSAPVRAVQISKVAPVRSGDVFRQDDENEAQLEKLLDKEIDELYKLTQRYKKSPNRGELWLRLAELYVEKARLLSYRSQNKFDKDIADWEAKGRTGATPKLDLKVSREFNKNAIQLYEWFLADFPKDSKVDQSLFFLGYNYIEMGDVKRGVQYYEKLTKQFPNSPYVSESFFALGEYYFDNNDWKKAESNFKSVLQKRTARLYSFALYKLAWCFYRQGRVELAIKSLEQVISHSRKQVEVSKSQGLKSVNRIRLASEALKDIVPFYADARDYRNAKEYFLELGGDKALFALLERLAYVYSDAGKQEPARYIFKQLLAMKPTAPKAFDYQYQIVQNYASKGDRGIHRAELFNWIKEYGPESEWARANSGDAELQRRAYELRESTLRNYVLLNHQTAQNTHAAGVQKTARDGYEIYLKTFAKADRVAEMHFFYGELLYDLKKYDEASVQYDWVAENSGKENKYFEQAILNAVLAAEKNLPSDEDIRKKAGSSLDPIPYGPAEKKFFNAAERYIKTFPKGEKVPDIRFKTGRIAYANNHFDEALSTFQDIVKKYPKTQYATYAANLILDIYNLKKDYEGLAKAGNELLQNEDLKTSDASGDIKDAVEKATFKKAQDAEVAKDFEGSAKQYDTFAKKYPNSKLAPSARYNAAVNFERAGLIVPAIAGYKAVVDNRDKKNPTSPDVRRKSQRLLARLYEQTGQYEKAAVEFESYGHDNPKDQYEDESYYNAAILFEGLQQYTRAITNYEKYFKTSKKADKREALYSLAQVQEKRGALSLAIGYYEQYLASGSPNSEKVISSNFKIADLSKKLNRQSKYKEACTKTIAVQKKLSGGKGVGAPEAAQCKYELSLETVHELEAIRIPQSQKLQEEAIKRKLDLVSRVSNEMAEVVKYDDGDYVVAALSTVGRVNDHLAKSIIGAPKPKGLSADELKNYDAAIDKVAAPFRQKALESYRLAVEKAHQLHAYNKWMTEAMANINKMDPSSFADTGEKGQETKEIDLTGF